MPGADGTADASDSDGRDSGSSNLDGRELDGATPGADAHSDAQSGTDGSQDAGPDAFSDSVFDASSDTGADTHSPPDIELDTAASLPSATGQYCCPLDGENVVLCPIRVARASAASAAPAAMQFTLAFEPGSIHFVQFSDEWCFDDECFRLPVPPNGLSPTGHSVAIAPFKIEDWSAAGSGSLLITLLASPVPPLTDAYFNASGQIQNDSEILAAEISLPPAAPALESICFDVSGLVATDGSSLSLGAYAADDVIVVY